MTDSVTRSSPEASVGERLRVQTPAERDIRDRHRVDRTVSGLSWCPHDQAPQPCDTQVVLGILDALAATPAASDGSLDELAAKIAQDWNGRIVTSDDIRAAIERASSGTDLRLSEIDWDEVAGALRGSDGSLDVAEPFVRAMMDVLAARLRYFRAVLDEHPDQFVPVLVDAARSSDVRDTTEAKDG